jgi:glycosyltransferase involved in cell wall biosynthesis
VTPEQFHLHTNKNKKCKNIAYILTPVEFGGAERVSLSFLLNYQPKNKIVVPFILCRPWEKDNLFINELVRAGIKHYKIPTRLKPRGQGRDIFRVPRSAMLIYREIKTGNYDLIHTNGYFADIVGLIAAKLLKIPIVSTSHGFISNSWKYRLYNFLDVLSFRNLDKVIAVSDKLKQELVQKGVKKEKIKVIQNCVLVNDDIEEKQKCRSNIRKLYKIKKNEILIGYIGRLSVEKGLKYLIESLAILKTMSKPLRLIIIGDGPQYQELENMVGEKNLKNKIIFAGFQKDVVKIIPAFDIFILPSLTEGTSMALLEAMASGVPVVATAVGGTPNVIRSHKNGILVPPESPEDIANAIKKLVESENLREKLSKTALQTIKYNFSAVQWLKEIDFLYNSLILKKK